jgi:hypothetical protein
LLFILPDRMTHSQRSGKAHPPGIVSSQRPLNYQDSYLCPICRRGHISALTLMDAFACNFCRHIFTANLREQSVHVEDSSQPMAWRWNGRTWQAANQPDRDLTAIIWLVGSTLMVMPPTLIWLSYHIFPPLGGSTWQQFPLIWVGITFACHFLLVAWLLAEHHQIPFYVALKVLWQRWRS